MNVIRNPTEPGWYLGRPFPTSTNDEPPVVVRVVPDVEGGVTTVWKLGSRDPATLDQWRLVGKVSASGTVTDLQLKEAHADGRKQGYADREREQAEYEAKRDREHPEFGAGIRLDLGKRELGVVAIRIPVEHASDLQSSLSDFLCWARGYTAGLPRDDYDDRTPMGVAAIRDINTALKSALRRADEAKENRS